MMAESKLTVNVGGTAAQLTINVQPASVAGPKGDKGDKGDPGDANITTQGIVDALGYTPADQLVVEQLAEDVEDIRQNGSSGGSGGTGADGEDGGYYRPNVDASGSLSWTPSKSDMPAVGSVNIKGPQGEPGANGSDASVTSANIASALGYTPADQLRVDQLADEVADLKQSGGGGSGDGSGGTGADGEDGGYYTPRVDGEGNLSWVASKSGMPAVSTVNIKGPKGATGDKGDTGEAGPQGEPGSAGADGKDGVSATHSWNGTVLTVTSASGTSAADLKGEKGDTGEPGPAGANGNDGYTPVKGTDYFTAADKSELVNAVLTALPAAEGVSY